MNVTFHTLGAIATAAALTIKPGENWRSFSAFAKYAIGFVTGILIHGILDLSPHNYPFSSRLDIVQAILLFLITLAITRWQNWLLLIFCFIGCLFPDLIDLGPAIVTKHLGIPIPSLPFKIFPWHWKEFSGSIYDGSYAIESAACHIVFLAICFS